MKNNRNEILAEAGLYMGLHLAGLIAYDDMPAAAKAACALFTEEEQKEITKDIWSDVLEER